MTSMIPTGRQINLLDLQILRLRALPLPGEDHNLVSTFNAGLRDPKHIALQSAILKVIDNNES